MADVEKMGEVDELHSNSEEALVNGDASNDVEMENHGSPQSIKKVPASESMEVDQEHVTSTEDSKDSNPASNGNHSDDHDENSIDKNEEKDVEHKSSKKPISPKNVDENIMETDENSHEKNKEHRKSPDSTEGSQNSPDSTDETSQDSQNTQDTEDSQDSQTKKPKNDDENSNAPSEAKSEEASNPASEKIKENGEIEIHEIDDKDETVELHSSEDEGDVMIVDSPKTNGDNVIEIEETPEKKIRQKEEEITPRRSARNIKKRSYVESDKDSTPSPPPKPPAESEEEEEQEEESDIEEVVPQDPLAVSDQITIERVPAKKPPPITTPTISVKKNLVPVPTKTSTPITAPAKKEPTLVIIDTNSILSGRANLSMTKTPMSQVNTTPTPMTTMTTMNVSAIQGLYSSNVRAATITPIPVHTTAPPTIVKTQTVTAVATTPMAPLLPTLTDDMFVVEAPSFIVPYVYEKPPVKILKDFVEDIRKEILERKKAKKEKKDKEGDKENKDDKEKDEKSEKNKEDKDKDEKDKDKEDEDLDSDEEKKSKKEEEAKEKKKRKRNGEEDDDDYQASEDEKSSASEKGDGSSSSDEEDIEEPKTKEDESKKPYNYFSSPLGKFFTDIGFNLVQEYVQNDLLKQQKRKREREKGSNPETNKMIASLMKNLENSKGTNDPFKMQLKKCEFCNFKSESYLAMQYHLETPHMKNFVYKCNFCAFEVRSPHDILFHMEAEHCVRGHLERAPAFHQCPSCPFEDNQKGKLSRHLVVCARKFKPERNLEPPADWEPPAKIPRMPKLRQGLNATAAAYQAMNKVNQYQLLSKMQLQNANSALNRQRGRPSITTTVNSNMKINPAFIRPQGVVFKQQPLAGGGQTLVPLNYQLTGNQVFQVVGGGHQGGGELGGQQRLAFVPSSSTMASSARANLVQNPAAAAKKGTGGSPSISITPLPRGTTATPAVTAKPGDTNAKGSFVICEICDGYIKDLEQLRNHMQWIHKIKIHPKMIHNRPPLNCQKCQFRFFTDQGLERHLLGSHGLVTSSMQDAANKSKDSGRCPVCGRVYQWKLLNHVARDHNMTLKPAHLSYKCTVCTATFGMYKQFENHVYSAHSVVAKRVMDKKSAVPNPAAAAAAAAAKSNSLKINDEITIIPQPAKANGKDPKAAAGPSKNEGEAQKLSRSERLARRTASEHD